MSRYQLSKEFLSGIEELVKLDEPSFHNVLTVIKEMPAGTGPSTFRKRLGSQLNNAKSEILSAALFGLGSFYANEKKSVEDTTKEIAESFIEEKGENSSEEEKLILENRMTIILQNYGHFKTTFKAISLLTENGTIFRKSRILTDIRIVFGDELEATSHEAVILHQLKISTLVNGKSTDFFISLDESDLEKMVETLDRALKKSEKIRTEYKDKFDFITITD